MMWLLHIIACGLWGHDWQLVGYVDTGHSVGAYICRRCGVGELR